MALHNSYIKYLINSFYKCLCLFEEGNEELTKYIDSFSYEIYGLKYTVEDEYQDVIQTLINILEHFYDDSLEPLPDLDVIKREAFRCINLIESTFKVGDS